jgi:hypothetical protein
MERHQVEQRLEEVLTRAVGWIPANELEEMLALVRAGEPGIALENFCTQLEEYDVVVPNAMADELLSLALAMGLNTPAWIERAARA